MKQFSDKHKHERAFILGNGPSLKDVDLPALKRQGVVFGSNRIYLSGFVPDYFVCVNPLVLSQFKDEIAELDTIKFLSATNGVDLEGFDKAGSVHPLNTACRIPSFNTPDQSMWEGFTVTYVAMQLASYMGFKEIVLLGLDHDYGKAYQPNIEVMGSDEDKGHFDASYFGQGVRWHAPDLANSEIAYSLAKAHFDKKGVDVWNASTHTKLNVVPLDSLNHLQNGPRVSAIVSAYKCEKYLRGCLQDLSNQTEDCEIVVVCQENSAEYEIAMDFPCNILLTVDIPTVYAAWNMGAKAAHGKYLTNANSDDRHHPAAFEIMADILDARQDVDLVYHDQYVTWEANQTFRDFYRANDGKDLVSGRWQGKPGYLSWPDYSKRTLAQGCYIGPQPMWRASLHQRYGYFGAQYESAGDYEFWMRCAGERNYLHIPHALGLYLARPDGIELGNPVTSQEESTSAIYLHQTQDFEVQPLGGKFYRLNLGDEFIALEADRFRELVTFIEQQEAESAAVRLPVPERS